MVCKWGLLTILTNWDDPPSRWWQLKYCFMFIPTVPGEMIRSQFDLRIFFKWVGKKTPTKSKIIHSSQLRASFPPENGCSWKTFSASLLGAFVRPIFRGVCGVCFREGKPLPTGYTGMAKGDCQTGGCVVNFLELIPTFRKSLMIHFHGTSPVCLPTNFHRNLPFMWGVNISSSRGNPSPET